MKDPTDAILRNLLTQTTQAYEAKLAELEAEKAWNQITLASLGDGVMRLDTEARIEYLNPAAERLLNLSLAEVEGMLVSEIVEVTNEVTGDRFEFPIQTCLASEAPLVLDESLVISCSERSRVPVSGTMARIPGSDAQAAAVVVVFRDISETRHLSLQLAHQARHDALTGLANRRAFERWLREALESSWSEGQRHVLAFVDLDRFKIVNDTCGHAAGDRLLRRVGRLFMELVRASDVVGRLGGDEFGILLWDCPIPRARGILQDLLARITNLGFVWQSTRLEIGASVGLVAVDGSFGSLVELLSAADHACYAAKREGSNRIREYRSDDEGIARQSGEAKWVVEVEDALRESRFELFAQEIRPSLNGDDEGRRFEVLLRMRGRDGELFSPMQFLPAAERFGLVTRLDRWVFKELLDWVVSLDSLARDRLRLCCVNLSALSVGDKQLLPFIRSELEASGVDPGILCFEITETAAVSDLEQAGILIRELTQLGCRFALDDFGTGMSSYGYLRQLPVEFVKIDGIFVQEMLAEPLDRAFVDSIHRIAGVMGARTIAESVSSEELALAAREIGVDYLQGYWIGHPAPLVDWKLS